MTIRTARKISAKTVKRVRPPIRNDAPEHSIEVACPTCGRRAFDLSKPPVEALWVSLKCPHCKNIIDVECKPGASP